MARGEEAAFEELLRRYEASLGAFLRRLAGGRQGEVEDAVQEALLAIWRSAREFRGQSRGSTWLFATARNVFLHQLRRARLDAVEPEESLAELPCLNPGQLEALEARERERILRGAVDALPDRLALVVMLREWEELSYEEIARVLEVPVGTVRSRLHHARAALAVSVGRALEGAAR